MTEPPTDTPQPSDAGRGATDAEAGTATGPWRFATMIGSSIAARDAAPWVTDFLNAAYYRRPADERDVDDLRLASTVVTTYWWRKEPRRRLRAFDLPAFHRAFGRARLDTARSARGTMDRRELLDGSAHLLGDWFPDAYADDERRAWGIAFATTQERDDYDPGVRLALAPVGELTPERAPLAEQVWHTYPPVAMPSAEAVIGALTRPERWPDFASEIGRFTPLRPGGLLGQTFEIEVAAGTETGRPLFTRGYVTVTKLVTPDDPAALQEWFADVQRGMVAYGRDEPALLPSGATPLVGFDLTTHAGHFMGGGHNRLLLYEHEGNALVRAAGTWDPMPWHLERAYQLSGRDAQHTFWGQGGIERLSMLHQLADRA